MFIISDVVMDNHIDLVVVVSEIYGHDYRCCATMPKDEFIRRYKGTDVWRSPARRYHLDVEGNQRLLKIIL